ncbi:MAG: hypothetical protein LIO71_07235 [Ruminococcus sp.]|nr:hypothetical protein [Ruminococcus sp.]
MDTLENHQEDFNTTDIDTLEDLESESQHVSDVLVTQIILCIAILTGVFILNIFKPDISTYIIDTFKYQTSVELSDTLKGLIGWLYDRVQS